MVVGLRSLDQREVDAWRLPVLAARLAEEIEEFASQHSLRPLSSCIRCEMRR